jgi:hypothetical protein
MLLTETLHTLAAELGELLPSNGSSELAAQFSSLKIIDRCRCEDDFCPSFYTQPKPKGSYGPNLHKIALDSCAGMLMLDVINGKMMFVEVLNNDANRKWLFGGAAVRRNR